jgi:putative DNA primase/helicase
LRIGKLRDGRPDDRITKISPVEFHPDAKCERWEKFLREIFCQDQEIVDYIHKAIGYSLTGDTSEQCFFLCFGGGHNGKSRFIEVLTNLLGRELTTTLDFDSLSLSDRPKYELADVGRCTSGAGIGE